MINLILRNGARFVVLVFLQAVLFDNMQLSHSMLPFIYVLFILLLPFETPGWLVLISSFLLGGTVDLFEHTMGLHAAAATIMGFSRPGILKIFSPRDGYEVNTYPRIYYYGAGWFIRYTLTLVFIHHFFLFYLEAFSFQHFFTTLARVILSALYSSLLIVLSQYLVYRK